MTTETNSKATKATKPSITPPKTVATSTIDNSAQPLDTLIAAPLKVRTSKTINLKRGPQESSSEEEILEVHKFVTQPAIATVSIPLKMTMDFQSMGIEIGVSLPCYAEEIDAGVQRAWEIAHSHIISNMPKIQEALLEATGRSKAK